MMKKPLQPRRELSEKQTAMAFLAPALIVIAIVNMYPILNTVFISLQHENLLDSSKSGFAGLYNYIDIFMSPSFWNSLSITLYFAIASIVIQVFFGILIALLLNIDFKGRKFVRGIIIVPWAIPTLVNASLWNWIFNANYGVLNRLLLQFNIVDEPVLWMSEATLALNMLIIADSWHMLPLSIIMMLAALQTVDESAIQASLIDGANAFQRFWYIKMPVMRPLLLVLLIMRTTQTLKVFDIIYMTTHGGPSNGTMVISFYTYYEIFRNMDFGRGAALSIIMSVLVMAIALVYNKILNSSDKTVKRRRVK